MADDADAFEPAVQRLLLNSAGSQGPSAHRHPTKIIAATGSRIPIPENGAFIWHKTEPDGVWAEGEVSCGAVDGPYGRVALASLVK
jgi:hypothetical protein